MNTDWYPFSSWMDQCEQLVEEIRELQEMHAALLHRTQELAERLGNPSGPIAREFGDLQLS
ncbi:MAG: hypothetical protein U0487_02285 [Patescibacteria group bacterium]